jgi:putative addiction module component (TIGR02574 family)
MIKMKGQTEEPAMSPTFKSLGIDQLSVSDRMRLVEEIWESIESTPKPLAPEPAPSEVPKWHLEELDRRLADDEVSPEPGIPWDQAYARLQRRLRESGK